jgi:cytochrome c
MTSKKPSLSCSRVILAVVVLVTARSIMVETAAAQDSLALAAEAMPHSATSKPLGIGRLATPEEIAGWDIDIRPDGEGLPLGSGTVKDGEAIYTQRCAGCHGEFGEGVGRWPALAGGAGMLTADRPVKTIGSFWPYASTVLDYVRRAQPFGNAQSLRHDELYAVVAYLLFLNDIVDDNFALTKETFRQLRMPNEGGFYNDDRENTEQAFWSRDPCMTNCKASVQITGRAPVLDAIPATRARHRGAE